MIRHRPRVLVRSIALAALAWAAACGAQPADTSFFGRLRAARALAADGDRAAARAELLALDAIAGGFPSAAWNLAVIAAREGAHDEALRRLGTLADMGLAIRPKRDSTFAALWGDARFEALVERFADNAAPVAHAEVVATLPDTALLAEDLAYDPRTETLYVSSIHRGKVIARGPDGAFRDFTTPGEAGVWGVYGLAIDPGRDVLWASTAAGENVEGHVAADSGRTAIVGWALSSGRRVAHAELPRDGRPHVLGDICLGPDGTVYATDSFGGGLYRLRPGAAALDTLAPPGTFGSPQMPVVAADGRRLYVADYPRGIVAFDLASRVVATLPKPPALAATGIDGMVALRDGLVAIQNGTPPIRVLWLPLDPDGARITGWTILEQGSPELGEPNHGAVAGDALWFIGNSGWDRVGADGTLATPAGAKPPVILALPLPGAPR